MMSVCGSESDHLLCDRITFVIQLDVEQSPSTLCAIDRLQHSNDVLESFLSISLISPLHTSCHLEQSWEAIKKGTVVASRVQRVPGQGDQSS